MKQQNEMKMKQKKNMLILHDNLENIYHGYCNERFITECVSKHMSLGWLGLTYGKDNGTII